MASTSEQACSSTKSKNTKVPDNIMDLLDVAIFSFGCQSGLRSYHKIRGDPVLEGVSAFFGRLLLCSSTETLELLKSIAPTRLGNWEPGSVPSEQLLTLVSSRIKTLKSRGDIREKDYPEVPNLLLYKKQKYVEEGDRLKMWRFPKCWRCGVRCEFCRQKKKTFPHYVDNFNVDIASPFLEVLEDMLKEECAGTASSEDDTGDDDDNGTDNNDDDAEHDHDHLLQCASNTDFPDDTDDDDDEYLTANNRDHETDSNELFSEDEEEED